MPLCFVGVQFDYQQNWEYAVVSDGRIIPDCRSESMFLLDSEPWVAGGSEALPSLQEGRLLKMKGA